MADALLIRLEKLRSLLFASVELANDGQDLLGERIDQLLLTLGLVVHIELGAGAAVAHVGGELTLEVALILRDFLRGLPNDLARHHVEGVDGDSRLLELRMLLGEVGGLLVLRLLVVLLTELGPLEPYILIGVSGGISDDEDLRQWNSVVV